MTGVVMNVEHHPELAEERARIEEAEEVLRRVLMELFASTATCSLALAVTCL